MEIENSAEALEDEVKEVLQKIEQKAGGKKLKIREKQEREVLENWSRRSDVYTIGVLERELEGRKQSKKQWKRFHRNLGLHWQSSGQTPCFHHRGPGIDPWSGN